jgi:hypothetical protein
MKTSERISNDHSPIVLAVSLVAGFGLTLMIVVLGIGAVQGGAADTGAITVGFLLGLVIFALGVIAWFVKVQPQRHFDDINQPAPDDHGHSHDDHAHDEGQPAAAGHH